MQYISLLLLLSLIAGPALGGSVITGTAAYRERIALPPDAIFEATLEDISRADAAAEILGRVTLERPGQPPFKFEISYDPTQVQENHSYSVRARVLAGGKLLFTTDRIAPVLTRGHGQQVSLMLRRAGGRLPAAAKPGPGQVLGVLPATFTGDLPCADCPGIRYQLDLLPDQVFFRRMTYLDTQRSFDDLGAWAVSPDGTTLSLQPGREAPTRFAIKNAGTLRQLDAEGKEIDSALNYDLKRTSAVPPLDPKLLLRGSYHYMADAGLFTECHTRRRLPVAQESDNAALEAAYTEARRHPGEEIVATVEGRIALRPKVDGEGKQPTLVVERFVGLAPGETCGSQFGQADLVNTLWKLTRLGDTPIVPGEKQRVPNMVLHSEGNKLAGFGGCNRLMGGYRVEGDKLSFGQVASTRMACPAGMDTERAFLQALERTQSYKIAGEHLELLGADGQALARFEALYLR